MRPLRYSINITLDGCCDHGAGLPDAETHQHATERIARADALILGRVTYELMESAWKPPGMLDQMPDYTRPFAETIDAARKYVFSTTRDEFGWRNTEHLTGDLGDEIRALKAEPGEGLALGGVTLPLALAMLGLIDEYEFIVMPRIAGHGPTPFAGLADYVDLELIDRREFSGGAVALNYAVRR